MKRIVYPVTAPLVLSLFLTVLTLVGCGDKSDDQNRQNLNGQFAAPADLVPYIDEFVAAAAAHEKPVSTTLGMLEVIYDEGLPGAVAGRCEQWPNRKLVKVKKSRWDGMTEATRQSLIFHELGHCLLGRKHDAATVERGGLVEAASLMSAEIVDGRIFEDHRDEYLAELFK